MAIDSPLHLPEQPEPRTPDTTTWDGCDPQTRPQPGLGPELLGRVRAVAEDLDQLPGAIGQLGNEELTDLVSVLLRVQARAAQVATLATADAAGRGAIDASDAANTTQWVRGCATSAGVGIEPAQASMISAVAQACRDRRNHVIASAVRDGSCTLATARTALRQTAKVAEVLPTAARDDIQSWFLQLDPALGSRGVTELTRRIIARYDPDKLSAEDAHLERVESLTWRTLPTGMIRLIADLCPANAAVLKQAITSLAAPHPATQQEADKSSAEEQTAADNEEGAETAENTADSSDVPRHAGADRAGCPDRPVTTEKVLDSRTPGKRRVDALVDLVGAGAKVAHSDGISIGAAATMLVTLDLHRLLDDLDGAVTIGGELLDAGTARRLACDADLVPIVLGGPSQPLDVGRRQRVVTKGMRAAVVHRDRGCTFPGCDRPPGFCEVHHLRPWWAGGDTALTNSAMLCRRHHHTVHHHGYMAAVTTTGVTWDLTEGAMPEWRADLAA